MPSTLSQQKVSRRSEYENWLPKGDGSWFEVVGTGEEKRLKAQEGDDITTYDLGKTSAKKDETDYHHEQQVLKEVGILLIDSGGDAKELFEHRLERILQAARQPSPPTREMGKESKDRKFALLIKQGETLKTHRPIIMERRRAALYSRSQYRLSASKRLHELARTAEKWKESGLLKDLSACYTAADVLKKEVNDIYEEFRKGWLGWRDYTGTCAGLAHVLVRNTDTRFSIEQSAVI